MVERARPVKKLAGAARPRRANRELARSAKETSEPSRASSGELLQEGENLSELSGGEPDGVGSNSEPAARFEKVVVAVIKGHILDPL